MTDYEPEKCHYDYLRENMSIEAWTWEFVRRDPGFRATWAKYMSRLGTSPTPSVYLRDDSQTRDIVKDKK